VRTPSITKAPPPTEAAELSDRAAPHGQRPFGLGRIVDNRRGVLIRADFHLGRSGIGELRPYQRCGCLLGHRRAAAHLRQPVIQGAAEQPMAAQADSDGISVDLAADSVERRRHGVRIQQEIALEHESASQAPKA
jgi:hypothetical protein